MLQGVMSTPLQCQTEKLRYSVKLKLNLTMLFFSCHTNTVKQYYKSNMLL